MMAVLECDCGSHMFTFDGEYYTCETCGDMYSTEIAGQHLVMTEVND